MNTYEVPKEDLPRGIKYKMVIGKKPEVEKLKFGKAPAILKILPYLEWGNQAYKPAPKWAK